MSENLQNAFLVSIMIANYYDKLIKYTITDEEDSEEYLECIKNIQKAKITEKEMYQRLQFKEIVDYLNSKKFKEDINSNATLAQVRIFKKLVKAGEKYFEENIYNNNPLSNTIDNAISVEALKKTYRLIEDLDEYTVDDTQVLYQLKAHNKICKYAHLIDDDNMEDIALKYNFDIEKISLKTLKQIKEENKNKRNQPIMPILYIKFFKELNSLENINFNEPVLNTYYGYIILTKIEIILNNLDKKTLEKIISKCERDYKNKNSEILGYAKKLIRERKKELL